MSAIKIFLVDDHQMLIDGLKALLADDALFNIVGEAQTAQKALEEIPKTRPDILLTDINMPEMDGMELTRKIKASFPEIKVIALSMFGERNTIADMLDAGVNGYILKNTGKEELVNALKKVKEGGMYFSNEVSAEMMKAISVQRKNEKSTQQANLTVREREIIELIAKEMSNAQIAEKLFISERTVETHRKNIFRKTETKSIVGLIKWAFENKIIC